MNIHGAHSYWKQGTLGAAGHASGAHGLELGRSVRHTGAGRGHIVMPRAQLDGIQLQSIGRHPMVDICNAIAPV